MKRSPKRRLLQITLGALLIMAGWYFLDNVETVGAEILGCTYRAAPSRPGEVETCFGISPVKITAIEAVGAALVLAGIAAAADAIGFNSAA